jgi:predicted methyltransferase
MKKNHSAISSLYLAALLLTGASSHAHADALDDVLATQSIEVQARYEARHPKETLSLFGIEPGMIVIEAFPGGGWYTDILLPLIGPQGQLIGADYAFDMYPKFNFYAADYLAAKKTWAKTWTESAIGRHGYCGAKVGAFAFGSMTGDVDGKVDAVLLVRALHNLARFEDDGGYLSTALKEIHRALKPRGVVGIVQHIAPEEAPDSWADGSNGYLKKSFVVSTMISAGFELVSDSDVNMNPADQPQEGDIVWRLSPSFATSRNDENLRRKLSAIGESTRMTLLFRKLN